MKKSFVTLFILLLLAGCNSSGPMNEVTSDANESASKNQDQEITISEMSQIQEEQSGAENIPEKEIELTDEQKESSEKMARIFGGAEFTTKATGYLKTVTIQDDYFGEDPVTQAYFLMTNFEEDAFRQSIQYGIDIGNGVNKKEGEDYLFGLGCFDSGKIIGKTYEKTTPYLNEETQQAILNSSEENQITLEFNFGLHEGTGCACCNLAHSIRLI